jgi:mRNA-degrading endonuclease RelE of RelBE toxin-antitoxin system
MSFRLQFAPTADASFANLPRWAQVRFNAAFVPLEQEPHGRQSGLDVHQLYGYKNVWTLRIPPYRGIYAIDGNEVVMVIFGHRDMVYQELHALLPPRRQVVSTASLSRRR